MLELKGLSYQVEDNGVKTEILRGIDLTIEDNKFVVITGPNGGGKTTLAKTIMGLAKSTGGQIVWNGTDISGLSITERAKLGISYGFQQPPRFKGLRVRDLLELASGKRKLTRDECCSYLNRVGLCAADYVDREVDTSLSGGEVKRIEIATILARPGGLDALGVLASLGILLDQQVLLALEGGDLVPLERDVAAIVGLQQQLAAVEQGDLAGKAVTVLHPDRIGKGRGGTCKGSEAQQDSRQHEHKSTELGSKRPALSKCRAAEQGPGHGR